MFRQPVFRNVLTNHVRDTRQAAQRPHFIIKENAELPFLRTRAEILRRIRNARAAADRHRRFTHKHMWDLRRVESARHVIAFIQKAFPAAVKFFKLAFVIFLVDQFSFPVEPIGEERMRPGQRVEHVHRRDHRVRAEINISLSVLGKARLKRPDPAVRAAVIQCHAHLRITRRSAHGRTHPHRRAADRQCPHPRPQSARGGQAPA